MNTTFSFQIQLTQERFLLGKPALGGAQYSWHIPVSYMMANGTIVADDVTWMQADKSNPDRITTITLPENVPNSAALIFNVKETGYYR